MPTAVVFLLTVGLFSPTISYDWIRNWDDGPLLLYNAHLVTWDFTWMWRPSFGHWIPLTWITHTLDAHLWGLWAGGWHLENILLHGGSAVCLYVIALRLLRHPGAAMVVALLFALHPMRIESVAWVVERKDTLSTFFALLTVLLYLRAVDRQRPPWWALATFVLAVMSKVIAVMVTPWLLLLDWAVLHRRAWREKAPFVLVSAVGTGIAFWAMHYGVGAPSLMRWDQVGWGPRLLHVAYSEVYYAWRTLWPSRLSYMIEYTWVPSWDQPQYPIAVGVVLLVAVVLLLTRRRWPALTAACGAYAIAVFPQAGLFQNGPQLVANRYSYLASIPLLLLAGAGVLWVARLRPRLAWTSTALAIALLASVTMHTLPAWRNDATLQAYGAQAEPTCTRCQDWAAVYAYQRGDLVAARRYFERAIAVSATTPMPRWERHWGLASILEQLGDRDAAAERFRIYLASVPRQWWDEPYEQLHIRDAQSRLAQLERRP